MKLKLSPKAIILGSLVNIGGSVALGMLISLLIIIAALVKLIDTSRSMDAIHNNVMVRSGILFLDLYFTYLGGVVAARIAPEQKLNNAIATGVVAVIFEVISLPLAATMPLWHVATSMVLAIPAAYLGGRVVANQQPPVSAKPILATQPNRKLPAWAIALISVGLVLVVLFGLGFMAFRLFLGNLSTSLQRSEIFLRDLATDRETRLTSDGYNTLPKISPDGKFVAYTHTSGLTGKTLPVLRVLDLASGKSADLANDQVGKSEVSWTADSLALYYLVTEGKSRDYWRLDLRTGAKQPLTSDHADKSHGQLSPDGKWLAFVQDDPRGRQEIFLAPASGGPKKQLTHTKHFMNIPEGLAWTADGKHLAYLTPLHIFIMDIHGVLQKTVDVLPLQNPTNFFAHRSNPDMLFFKARLKPSALTWKLIAYNLADNTFTPLLDAQLISYYDLSGDGNLLVFAKTAPQGP
jgi:hypothetical protein